MRRYWIVIAAMTLALFTLGSPEIALAQNSQPTSQFPALLLSTAYPSQVIGVGETVNMDLKLRTGTAPQVVQLSANDVPKGWTVSFRGGGHDVNSVYVEPGSDATVTLRVAPPADVKAGAYTLTVVAKGDKDQSELPVVLTVQEKLPPSLSLKADLPTLRGKPSGSFSYNVTLRNEGSEDLSVNLSADAPAGFDVSFTLAGQDVTDVPVAANESKQLSVSAKPRSDIQGGSYPIKIIAQGGGAQATTTLTADVTGEATLDITTPDGRLSGQAYAGKETPLKITVKNTGSAPANSIQLSASSPSGWTVDFNPKQIDQIAAGQSQDVDVKVTPSDKAVAGDYMMTITGNSSDGASKSVDFRVTVLTSTLWGIAGVGLIAVAVGVVGLAVMRFGRR